MPDLSKEKNNSVLTSPAPEKLENSWKQWEKNIIKES